MKPDDLEVAAGTVLCAEGSRGHEFFVITDREAAVTRGGEQLAMLRSGDSFGEMAVLDPVRRTGTVPDDTPKTSSHISAEPNDVSVRKLTGRHGRAGMLRLAT